MGHDNADKTEQDFDMWMSAAEKAYLGSNHN